MRLRLDLDKLECLDIAHNQAVVLNSLPVAECLDRIIFDNEDDITIGPEDERLDGHTLRAFIAKDTNPLRIYVHVDGRYAALYSYFSKEFCERSDVVIPLPV